MAITFDNSGKPTYMFQAGATSTDGIWFAVAGKVDTAAGYEWGGTQTFLILRDGFNNFLNPAARDAALTAPVHGTLAFVRQDAIGNTINQIQYYNGTAWVANDGDISGVTAGTGLTGGGTAGTITLNVDTTVVATTNNTLTMSGKTLTSPVVNTGTLNSPILVGPEERVNTVASAATGTVNIDTLTAGTWYYTSNATGNHTINLRGSATTSMNTILATGDSQTVAWLNTNGTTPYYVTSVQVDGSAQTVKWQNGAAPSAGNASSIDAYIFTVIKTGSATFTVLGSQTKFA
jgi:hypothetical protein